MHSERNQARRANMRNTPEPTPTKITWEIVKDAIYYVVILIQELVRELLEGGNKAKRPKGTERGNHFLPMHLFHAFCKLQHTIESSCYFRLYSIDLIY